MVLVLDWLRCNQKLLWWLTASSLIVFVGTLIIVPLLLIRIPPDYFARAGKMKLPLAHCSPLMGVVAKVCKNALGVLFVITGIFMLILPGQGILTILAGAMLLNFPGKDKFIRWVVSRESVFQSINWLRKKGGRPPILLDS